MVMESVHGLRRRTHAQGTQRGDKHPRPLPGEAAEVTGDGSPGTQPVDVRGKAASVTWVT